VRDANATFTARHLRPVQVDPASPGAFGDAVARHLPPIQAESNALKDAGLTPDIARAVVAGERPLSDVPAPFARALARLEPHLHALLIGTHAERADLPPTRDAFIPCDGTDWTGYQFAALLAGLIARRDLSAGDAAGATAVCLDGLALGRDAAISAGLVGQMVGSAIVARLTPACAAALAALDPVARQAATERVRAIRDQFPPVEEMFRVDFLSGEVLTYGPAMDSGARSRLAREVLPHLRAGEHAVGFWNRLVIRDAWRGTRATWDALIRIARLNRGVARDAGFLAVDADALRRTNPLVAMLPVKAYAKYARRADAAVLRLDGLAASAAAVTHRERKGAWPTSMAELTSARLVSSAETERCADTTFTVREGGRVLELRLRLPTVDDKGSREDFALRVIPRAVLGAGPSR
jgi:hypothetical protein